MIMYKYYTFYISEFIIKVFQDGTPLFFTTGTERKMAFGLHTLP